MRGTRRGFTLVELLIVVVIIGILVAVAASNSRRTTRRAYQAALEADLKNLATHQELFHQVNLRYAPLEELASFAASTGITVDLTFVNNIAFAATAKHAAGAALEFGYYIGEDASSLADPATGSEARIVCAG